MAKLRSNNNNSIEIDGNEAKKLGIPLKDMIKINRELREMGY
jgi:hypothetical protein